MNLLTNLIFFAQANLGGGSAPAGPVVGGGSAGASAAGQAAADVAAGGGAATPPPPGGGMEQLLFIGFMIAVFYFLLIRPQQKRAKKHKEMVKELGPGDHVITNSGIFGKISAMDDTSVTLEVAKNTRIRVLKSFVGGLANPETEQELAQQPQG